MTIQQTAEAYCIATTICEAKNFRLGKVLSKDSHREVVVIRQMIHYFIKKHLQSRGVSEREIGQMFGGLDHSTVSYSERTVNNMLRYPDYRSEHEFIKGKIKEGLLKLRSAEQSEVQRWRGKLELLASEVPYSLNGTRQVTIDMINDILKLTASA